MRLVLALLASAVAAAAAASAAPAQPAPLARVLFNASFSAATGARCLDGSPSGLFWRAGDARRFVVFLEGGGACWSLETCAARAKTALGSSAFWPASMTDGDNVLSSDPAVSAFAGWSAVFVPYCGGDVHLGTRRSVVDPQAFPLYFSGHLTLGAVLDYLKAEHGLGGAAELLLSGASAGGIGSIVSADFVADALPGVAVSVAPQAGWFFPPVVNFTAWTADPNSGPPFAGQDTPINALWQAYEPPACVATKGAGYCGSVNFAFPFLRTRVHLSQDLEDSNMLFAQLGVPADNSSAARAFTAPYFQGAMVAGLAQIARARDAVWAPGCVAHTENLNLLSETTVAGVTMKESLDSWYFGGNVAPRLVDSCRGVNCGAGCPASASLYAHEPWLRF